MYRVSFLMHIKSIKFDIKNRPIKFNGNLIRPVVHHHSVVAKYRLIIFKLPLIRLYITRLYIKRRC